MNYIICWHRGYHGKHGQSLTRYMSMHPRNADLKKFWSFEADDAVLLSEEEMNDFMKSHHAKIIGNHGSNGIYTDTFRVVDENNWMIRAVLES